MNRSRRGLVAAALAGLAVPATAQPAPTIYNQDFAVVRERGAGLSERILVRASVPSGNRIG